MLLLSFLCNISLDFRKICFFFRNAKVGDLPEHKFEIDIELEGKAEEVSLDSLFTVIVHSFFSDRQHKCFGCFYCWHET